MPWCFILLPAAVNLLNMIASHHLYCIYVYSTKKENPHSKYCVCFHQSYFMIRFPVTGEKKFLSGHAKLKYISCV